MAPVPHVYATLNYRARRESISKPASAAPLEAQSQAVHDTIAEIDGLSTTSEGSDSDRRVVISVTSD